MVSLRVVQESTGKGPRALSEDGWEGERALRYIPGHTLTNSLRACFSSLPDQPQRSPPRLWSQLRPRLRSRSTPHDIDGGLTHHLSLIFEIHLSTCRTFRSRFQPQSSIGLPHLGHIVETFNFSYLTEAIQKLLTSRIWQGTEYLLFYFISFHGLVLGPEIRSI